MVSLSFSDPLFILAIYGWTHCSLLALNNQAMHHIAMHEEMHLMILLSCPAEATSITCVGKSCLQDFLLSAVAFCVLLS